MDLGGTRGNKEGMNFSPDIIQKWSAKHDLKVDKEDLPFIYEDL